MEREMTQMIEGTVLTGEELMQSLPDEMLLHSGYPQITQGTVESGVDRTAMAVPFTIVTRQKSVNRNGNKVQIVPDENGKGGISLVNYARNPIVMLDHGMSFALPIGVSEDATGKLTVKLSKTKATAVAHFSQVLPEAIQVFALIDEGILRTASISFRPLKGLIVDGNDGPEMDHKTGVIEFKPWMSFDFIESEMLEWSVVGIPADPDAVKKHLAEYASRDAKDGRRESRPGSWCGLAAC
jgi:phage head maturation protease